jgi:hypothetical protein
MNRNRTAAKPQPQREGEDGAQKRDAVTEAAEKSFPVRDAPSGTPTTETGLPSRTETTLMPADDWIELKWAEARMTLRGANGKLHNYAAAAVLRGKRCHESRVRRTTGGNVAADPALRTSPPATVVMRDEIIGACYLFAQI